MVQKQSAPEIGREPPPDTLTYEEFLEWCDEDTLAEWVDGKVIMYSPASDRHQDLADLLTSVLRIYVECQELGRVRSAPFQMKIGPDLPGREPDVLFVAGEHLSRLKATYLDGPADLVIEIVSPESAARDRGAKFYEYAAGGVPEYWLIDPQSRFAEFYELEGDHYRTVLSTREGQFESHVVPGLWLRVEWFWQDPLPRVLDLLRELGVV